MRNSRAPAGTRRRTSRWWRSRRSRWSGWRRPARGWKTSCRCPRLQEGLLFHALYDDTAPDVYTVQIVVELEGVLDAGRLRAAAQALLDRHANLRASIHHEGLERPVQVIPRAVEVPWREIDLSALPGEAQEARRAELLAADRAERFVPAAGPLLRWTLLRLGPERHLLVLTNHHILLDGWSMPVSWASCWRCTATAGTPTHCRGCGRMRTTWPGWRRRTPVRRWRRGGTTWPIWTGRRGWPRPAARDGSPAMPERWQTDLPAELTARLHGLARQRGLTLNTVVQGLWAVLLGRLTGRDDVVFGVTVSGRPAELAGVERMVGLFINTLPLRVRLRPGEPLATLLAGIQESQSRLLAHQHVGLAEIQRAAGIGELFDTLVVFENYPVDRAAPGRAGRGPAGCRGRGSRCGALSAEPGGGARRAAAPAAGLRPGAIRRGRRPKRSPRDWCGCWSRRWQSPDVPLHRLEVLEPDERQMLLEGFNATAHAGARRRRCRSCSRPRRRARPRPWRVVFEGQELTYGELNARANRLAHHLIGLGVGPESLVGICLERSVEMVVALLAILKAGGAYLPLDPDYPEARLAYMLADAAPGLVLTHRRPRRAAAGGGAGARLWMRPRRRRRWAGPRRATRPDADRTAPLRPATPGLRHLHLGLHRHPQGRGRDPPERGAPVRFDPTLVPLRPAGCVDALPLLCIRFLGLGALGFAALGRAISSWCRRWSPVCRRSFSPLLVRQRVTVLNQTPSAFYQLMQADGEDPELGARLSLRHVIFGGEALAPVRLEDWYRRHPETVPVLVNMYGITETTVHVSYLALDRELAAHGRGKPDRREHPGPACVRAGRGGWSRCPWVWRASSTSPGRVWRGATWAVRV